MKQGCPLSPTLFGLILDGLLRYLQHHLHATGFLLGGAQVLDLLIMCCCWTPIRMSFSDSSMAAYCAQVVMQTSAETTAVMSSSKRSCTWLSSRIWVSSFPVVMVLQHPFRCCLANTLHQGAFSPGSWQLFGSGATEQLDRTPASSGPCGLFRHLPPPPATNCKRLTLPHFGGACTRRRL